MAKNLIVFAVVFVLPLFLGFATSMSPGYEHDEEHRVRAQGLLRSGPPRQLQALEPRIQRMDVSQTHHQIVHSAPNEQNFLLSRLGAVHSHTDMEAIFALHTRAEASVWHLLQRGNHASQTFYQEVANPLMHKLESRQRKPYSQSYLQRLESQFLDFIWQTVSANFELLREVDTVITELAANMAILQRSGVALNTMPLNGEHRTVHAMLAQLHLVRQRIHGLSGLRSTTWHRFMEIWNRNPADGSPYSHSWHMWQWQEL